MLFEYNEQLMRKNREIGNAHRRFSNLFNLAPVGYMTLDRDNKIVEANIASATMLVVPSRELCGKDFTEFVSPDCMKAFCQHRKQAHVGKRAGFEVELVNSFGKPFHAIVETFLNSDLRWLIAIMDISARKRAEDKLRGARDELHAAYEQLRAQTVQRQQVEEKLREFTQQLIGAQEEERRRLGRELHDHVGQLMTYLGLILDKARPQLDPDTYKDAKAVAWEILQQIRSLSSDLQPSMLASVGLIPSLGDLFERYSTLTKIRVQFDYDCAGIELPEDISLIAYRIAQEALTNVARHANVDEVKVRLSNHTGRVRLEVEDNGKGFDPISDVHSVGLTGMRERAQAVGGSFWIDSAPGRGAMVVVELPLPPANGE